MDRPRFAFVWAVVCVLLAVGLGGCRMARPLLLPVVGSAGDPGNGGAWDDTDLYLIDPVGDYPTVRLTNTPELMETDPDLNRDRDKVVYVERAVTAGGYLASRNSEDLPPAHPNDGLPDGGSVWTPVTVLQTGSRLVVTDTDGANRRVLHEAAGLFLTPVWSHNGKRIVFVELTLEGRLELYLINADGSGLETIGMGSSPSWRRDDAAIFYSAKTDLDGVYDQLRRRDLRTGVIHDHGLRGAGYTNLRAGASILYISPAYSQRSETVWLADANGGRHRITDPAPHEHDSAPVFFDSEGDLVFTRYNDETGTHRLMRIHRNTDDRVATPIEQPARHCFTRHGLWIAQHYPR